MKNMIHLEGNLGKAPTLTTIEGDKQVTKFNIAVNKSWTKNGIKSTRTDWFSIEIWGRLAVPASRLKKGDAVIVQGELRTGEYEKDGVKHYTTTVNASYLRKLDFSIFKSAGEDGADSESEIEEGESVPF